MAAAAAGGVAHYINSDPVMISTFEVTTSMCATSVSPFGFIWFDFAAGKLNITDGTQD